jgi:uracil permease
VIGAIVIGTLVSALFGLIDFSSVASASIVGLPDLQFPAFSFSAISIIAPVAIVTFLEHFADVSAVGKVVEKDFLKNPGVHKTLIGDGIATAIAGMIGGCANTTYSENIGALEITGVKKPRVLQYTAIMLILLAFLPKLAFLLHSVPTPVIGGISILLFGLISANGIKSLVQEKTDMKNHKNLFIVASMLVVGAGGTVIEFGSVEFSSLAVAALLGVVLNVGFNFKRIFRNQ